MKNQRLGFADELPKETVEPLECMISANLWPRFWLVSRNGLTSAAIRKAVSSIIPAYMVPTRADVLDRLPKNDNGKIDRNLLRTQYC